jgi:hypothetical protein
VSKFIFKLGEQMEHIDIGDMPNQIGSVRTFVNQVNKEVLDYRYVKCFSFDVHPTHLEFSSLAFQI